MLTDDVFDFVVGEEGKYLKVFDSILIGGVDEVLIELIWGSEVTVKEESALLGFAKLLAVGTGDR